MSTPTAPEWSRWMWVTTRCRTSFIVRPAASTPATRYGMEGVAPVSTRAGSSSTRRYALADEAFVGVQQVDQKRLLVGLDVGLTTGTYLLETRLYRRGGPFRLSLKFARSRQGPFSLVTDLV